MSEEMKLLRALCDALGFEVETNLDYKERKEAKENAMKYNRGIPLMDRRLKCSHANSGHPMLDIDKNGMYTSILTEPEISYKVSAKESE